jgi:hypothetical protein
MSSAVDLPNDPRSEQPRHCLANERRLTGAARDLWQRSGGLQVAEFAGNAIVVVDPAGKATIISAGAAIEATFGLAAGMRLDGLSGLAAELRAACDLIAFEPQPVPFEACLTAPGRACVLVRGVALPLSEGRDADAIPHLVQIFINWRELLDRAATTRIRREIGAALRISTPNPTKNDPFILKNARKAPRRR